MEAFDTLIPFTTIAFVPLTFTHTHEPAGAVGSAIDVPAAPANANTYWLRNGRVVLPTTANDDTV